MIMLSAGDFFDNRYRLIRKLGQGGFSEVWLAEDIKISDLEVALKIYMPGQITSGDMKNFIRKFGLTYNLNHSNLLVPNACREVNEMLYLVLRYCKQGSTAKLAGRISLAECWKFLYDVSSGLAYLHEKNIIHQDIKPDNVLIQDNTYLISDFDISTMARSTMRVGSMEPSAGTSCYMSPERFGADSVPVKAGDIWALGASLFELITGNLPFGDMGGLNQKSGAPIPSTSNSVPKDLRKIITLCLQKETWNRPTAQEIAGWCKQYFKTGKIRWKKKYKTILNPSLNWRKIFWIAGIIIAIAGIIAIEIYYAPPKPESQVTQEPTETQVPQKFQEPQEPTETQVPQKFQEPQVPTETQEPQKFQKPQEPTETQEPQVPQEPQKPTESQEPQKPPETPKPYIPAPGLLSKANSAFDKGDYDTALSFYEKVKMLDPHERTGYNRFLNKAKEIKSILGECDNNIKALLLKAQQLSDTNEIRELIRKC
jgi:serine/threonine protein kinase